MRFPSLHKLHAQKYKTSLSHRFMQCSGKPGRWVIFHIPFCAVSARGATRSGACQPGFRNFNSRPCERGDTGHQVGCREYHISIHVPARGATNIRLSLLGCIFYFNSRPCERGDLKAVVRGAVRTISIHAPARGATSSGTPTKGDTYDFNSRPCERGDPRTSLTKSPKSISIHAPARGATKAMASLIDLCVISIHAPARGATWRQCKYWMQRSFQFTPLREGRRGR